MIKRFMTKKLLLITLISCVILLATTGVLVGLNYKQEIILVIRDQETKQVYVSEAVEVNGVIESSWIHSVEKTPWHEKWIITDQGEFSLAETRFQSFGAGVPHHTEGHIRIVDGYTVMTGDTQVVPIYRWIHSQKAQFKLSYNGATILATDAVPHHSKVEMFIEMR